jgi:cobalt-zinc-cadmium efflux system outer membrane protein
LIDTKIRRWGQALLLAGALAGCATYTPEPLSPQRSLDAARGRDLSDPRLVAYVDAHLRPDTPRPPAWTFDALSWAAYRLNPGLAIERARLRVAQAGEITAGERPNPRLVLPLQYTANANPGESPYTLGLGLDIPIETAGKRDARIAQARQLARAAGFELGAAAWQVRNRLRSALLDLRHARHSAALLEAQVKLRAQVVDMLWLRVALGDAARVEPEQAQADLARLRQRQDQAQQAVVQAQAGIAQAVGVPLAAIALADLRLDPFDRLPAPVPEGEALDQALKNRADVQAALSDYQASQAALQLAVAGQYPDIHLGPGYTFDQGAHKYALSLSGIELPLFNRHEGEIAEAQARRREAAARFDAVMAQGVATVDQALAALQGARAQWALAERQARSQTRVAAAARRSFDAGAIGRLDLALADLQADAAALQREDAFDRLQRAAAALEDAVQRPLNVAADQPPEEQ